MKFGFRLPSALDNRPLTFEEFENRVQPGDLRFGDAGAVRADQDGAAWWWSRSSGPPGWWIPRSKCGRSRGRWTTCCTRSACAPSSNERVLVTTLTKRMSEDLAEYYAEVGREVQLPALGSDARSTASRSCATCGAASTTC